MDNPLDAAVSELLADSFALIPILFANDPKMKMLLTEQVPNMQSYTKKMWAALGARSAVDYVTLTANLSQAFLAAKPHTTLKCETYADFQNACSAWIERELHITLSAAEHEGKNALLVLSQEIAPAVNKKLQAIRSTQKA